MRLPMTTSSAPESHTDFDAVGNAVPLQAAPVLVLCP
jgi:hypothetical protein